MSTRSRQSPGNDRRAFPPSSIVSYRLGQHALAPTLQGPRQKDLVQESILRFVDTLAHWHSARSCRLPFLPPDNRPKPGRWRRPCRSRRTAGLQRQRAHGCTRPGCCWHPPLLHFQYCYLPVTHQLEELVQVEVSQWLGELVLGGDVVSHEWLGGGLVRRG